MTRYCLFLSLWLTFISLPIFAQPINILDSIAQYQVQSDNLFLSGMFPSSRTFLLNGLKKADNNIFFTALIDYTLGSLHDERSNVEQEKIQKIKSRIKNAYPYFENRNGELSYNYWQTHPEELPFPNSRILSTLKKFRLADDLDVTSMIYLNLETDSDTKDSLKIMINQFANDPKKGIQSTLPKYRDELVYNTWFADKMKQDIDACVVSNILLWVVENDLTMNQVDSSSIRWLKKIINEEDHLKYPHLISPHYQNSAIILYHLARLMAKSDPVHFSDVKTKFIQDIIKELNHCTKNSMEEVILLSSLYRLGEKPPYKLDFKVLKDDFQRFSWYKANFFYASPVLVKYILGERGIFQFHYRSEAYYWTLIYELDTLSKKDTLKK